MSASKAPYNYTPKPKERPELRQTDSLGVSHACQCSKPVAWYANGNKVFALVTYVTGLVWLTLVMADVVSPFAIPATLALWLLALVFAYGGDGKGGAL